MDSAAATITTKSAFAYGALRAAILENALIPGTKLPEDAIGVHFGVSRTLVRAALAQLASEGLVDVGKGKSAMVASPSPAEARETFQVRRTLEKEVVLRLAATWNAETHELLSAHCDAEQQAAEAGNTKLSTRLGAEFHSIMAGLTGNALLNRYVLEVISRCTLILAIYGQAHPQQESLDEHRALIEAMAAADGNRAAELVDRHIASVEHRALGNSADKRQNEDLGAILRQYSRNPTL